jgi:hypothetical protein
MPSAGYMAKLVLFQAVPQWYLAWWSSMMVQCKWSWDMTCPLSSSWCLGCHHSFLLTCRLCNEGMESMARVPPWCDPLFLSWIQVIFLSGSHSGGISVGSLS